MPKQRGCAGVWTISMSLNREFREGNLSWISKWPGLNFSMIVHEQSWHNIIWMSSKGIMMRISLLPNGLLTKLLTWNSLHPALHFQSSNLNYIIEHRAEQKR